MVREKLRVIVRPSQGFDPPRDLKVLLGASCSGDCRIGGITDERVGEDPLALVRHGGLAGAAHEHLSLERLQVLFDGPAILAACSCNGSGPEDATGHGRTLRDPLLGFRQGVETRDDQRLDGLGNLVSVALVGQHPHVLLGVERVAAGPHEQGGPIC